MAKGAMPTNGINPGVTFTETGQVTMTPEQYEMLRQMAMGGEEPTGEKKYKEFGPGARFPPPPNALGHRYFVIKDCWSQNGKGCICAGAACAREHTKRDIDLEHPGIQAFGGDSALEDAIVWYYGEYPDKLVDERLQVREREADLAGCFPLNSGWG